MPVRFVVRTRRLKQVKTEMYLKSICMLLMLLLYSKFEQ
nr:MAG TPA: hypothetical protein [Caudoviricetes sp.]